MSAERDMVVAYLRGMADAGERRAGGSLADDIRRRLTIAVLRHTANQIADGQHERAPSFFPEHMPLKYSISIDHAKR